MRMHDPRIRHASFKEACRQPKYRELLIVAIIIAAVVLLATHIGARALWDPDEGRYAEMGREVLVLKDWVTPHLNYLLYFEKPMLFVWMEALSQKAFGVNAAAARIPPLICALGIVWLIWLIASRQWGRRAGLVASVALLTSTEFFVLANAVDINMPLAFFITATLAFFWLGHFQNRPRYYYLAWICAGLATLTKGPVGFILPAVTVMLYIIATRQFKLILQVKPLTGLIVFLLVTVPWFALVCRRNPDFFNFFFINQNLMRYTTTIHERYKPFWYFVPVVIGGFLPWTFLLPEVINQIRKARPPLASEVWFAIIWFAVTFLFFVPSQSKLATYVLPCFMPLALLTGYAFRATDRKPGLTFYSAAGLWLILGAALLALPLLASLGPLAYLSHPEDLVPVMDHGLAMGATMLGGTILAVLAARKYGSTHGVAALGLTLMILGLSFAGDWDYKRSPQAIVKNLPANAQLCAYGKYFQSSSFYAGRPVFLVGAMGELAFGQSRPNSLTLTPGEFFRRLQTRKDFFCLTKWDRIQSIRDKVPDIRVVARQGEMVLINAEVTNR
ncbi:MAG: glycosyltransferase family 39 protein [Syntrophaceae bacterium]